MEFEARYKIMMKQNFLKRAAIIGKKNANKLDESNKDKSFCRASNITFRIENSSFFHQRATMRQVMLIEHIDNEIEREAEEQEKSEFLTKIGVTDLMKMKYKRQDTQAMNDQIFKDINRQDEEEESE